MNLDNRNIDLSKVSEVDKQDYCFDPKMKEIIREVKYRQMRSDYKQVNENTRQFALWQGLLFGVVMVAGCKYTLRMSNGVLVRWARYKQEGLQGNIIGKALPFFGGAMPFYYTRQYFQDSNFNGFYAE